MSRKEFENAQYMVAAGVDHTTSAFVQVWRQPHGEQDEPLVVVDSMGVRLCPGYERTPLGLRILLAETKERFELSRGRGVDRPNLDAQTVILMAQSVGIEGIDRDIFALWD